MIDERLVDEIGKVLCKTRRKTRVCIAKKYTRKFPYLY